MEHNEKIEFLKTFYKSMPEDEFRKRMEKAGLETVDDRPGRVFFDDETDRFEE